MAAHANNFPKLHNAAWPGVVGKGSPGAEPFIDLDTMLDLTAAAEVDGVKFDGVDLFLFAPHVDIDARDDDLKQLADKVTKREPEDRLDRRAGLGPARAAARRSAPRPSGSSSSSRSQRPAASPRSSASSASGHTASSASTRPAARGDWLNDPEGNQTHGRRDVPRGRRRRGRPRRAARRRRRNLLGRHALAGGAWCNCSK